jgi:uncharacterized protein YecE (DUF72 family)
VHVYVGTSGFSYPQWKGHFYPEQLSGAKMLGFYGGQFATVEINNTFYKMPTPEVVAAWGNQVPDGFRFSLKAPQRITHTKAFAESKEPVGFFFQAAAVLGPKLGPCLFQFPPWLKKDLSKLGEFAQLLPKDRYVAMEFRHESWFSHDVYDALGAAGISLVLAETDEAAANLVPVGRFGYLRLRKTEYADAELSAWAERIRAQPWEDAFVFFKHEDEGKGPAYAKRLKPFMPETLWGPSFTPPGSPPAPPASGTT